MLHACYIFATCEHISLLHIFHKEKEALLLLNKKKKSKSKSFVKYITRPNHFCFSPDSTFTHVFIAQCCVFRANEGRDARIVKMFVCIETERERERLQTRDGEDFIFLKKFELLWKVKKETTPQGDENIF